MSNVIINCLAVDLASVNCFEPCSKECASDAYIYVVHCTACRFIVFVVMVICFCCLFVSLFYIAGTYTTPGDKWKLTVDKKNRGGFIRELPEDSTAPDFCEKEDNAELVFTINKTMGELRSMKFQPGEGIAMNLVYLRSYINTGSIQIYVCGSQNVAFEIDALWSDRQYRYSLPQATTMQFEWDNGACRELKNDVKPTIMLKHHSRDEQCKPGMTTKLPRTTRMFKLVSISVCKF